MKTAEPEFQWPVVSHGLDLLSHIRHFPAARQFTADTSLEVVCRDFRRNGLWFNQVLALQHWRTI
jgi:hypothetical protein